MTAADESRRTVVGRVFDILDCFAGGAEIGVAAICERTNLPPATVHRFLSALVAWGGVERLSHGRYRLGARIWRLGIGAPEFRELRDLAQPYLVRLHMLTRGTVYLSMRDGHDAVFSDRITLVHSTSDSTRASRRMPLQDTGGGRAILAYNPDAWQDLVDSAADDDHREVFLPKLAHRLGEIRRRGVEITYDDSLPGRTSVAAPVTSADGTVDISVVVAFPSTRIPDPSTIVPHVISTAKDISDERAHRRRD